MCKKRMIKLSIVVSLLSVTGVYATNGDSLMAVGIKSRGMGGAGIAHGQGAESSLLNPALITDVEGHEISFGATIFMPTIKTDLGPTGKKTESDMDLSLIPEVSLAQNLGNGYYIGTGMWGTAGMGVDFKGTSRLMNMNTQLQLMQFAVPLAYKTGGLSLAIAPIVQYGSLDIAYTRQDGVRIGAGVSSDFGAGVSLGGTYNFGNGVKLGAMYKSKISMSYDGQISDATEPFNGAGVKIGDDLDQPAEYGIGAAYTYGAHNFALDLKRIAWSNAAGYKDFGWDNQTVVAVGYEYKQPTYAFRLGYNHGSSPVKELNGATPAGAALNMFNLLGFPATAEDHFTVGGSYYVNDSTSVDVALVHARDSKKKFDVSGLGMGSTIENSHKETGLSMQVTYKF